MKDTLKELYTLMLAGKLDAKQKERKRALIVTKRATGMMWTPFSLNSKKFKAL